MVAAECGYSYPKSRASHLPPATERNSVSGPGVGMTLRNTRRLHENDSVAGLDVTTADGSGDNGYDPLDGDSVSGMIIANAQEVILG